MDNPNLTTFVHFYNDSRHLFRTITMYSSREQQMILDRLVEDRIWYWGRYAPDHRGNYLARRLAVENMMYSEFVKGFGEPPCKSPVYFYLYPDLSEERLASHLKLRKDYSEHGTKYLLVELADLHDLTHVSFTIEDSLTSYGDVLERRGLQSLSKKKQMMKRVSDHGRLFGINDLKSVYRRYQHEHGLMFEVQIWDHDILRSVTGGVDPGCGNARTLSRDITFRCTRPRKEVS